MIRAASGAAVPSCIRARLSCPSLSAFPRKVDPLWPKRLPGSQGVQKHIGAGSDTDSFVALACPLTLA